MIERTLSLFGAMYGALGPGFLMAVALPVFLGAFAVLVGFGLKRRARRGRVTQAS